MVLSKTRREKSLTLMMLPSVCSLYQEALSNSMARSVLKDGPYHISVLLFSIEDICYRPHTQIATCSDKKFLFRDVAYVKSLAVKLTKIKFFVAWKSTLRTVALFSSFSLTKSGDRSLNRDYQQSWADLIRRLGLPLVLIIHSALLFLEEWVQECFLGSGPTNFRRPRGNGRPEKSVMYAIFCSSLVPVLKWVPVRVP